jgi:miniconductance mechanosensitive channel
MEDFRKWIESLLRDAGVAGDWIPYLRLIVLLILLGIVLYVAFFVTRRYVIRYLHSFLKKTPAKWDDVLADNKTFENLAHIVPAIIVKIFVPILFRDFEEMVPVVDKMIDIYLVIVGMLVFVSLLRAAEYLVQQSQAFNHKPIASYFQLARIILYITAGITVISLLLNKSPLVLLGAFGAMTAIILLIFKDTILGVVASVQISSNDMVRVGDWIEMPKFNADGDVIAINLHTVKVRNWDKTITTIPTYNLITDSFKNWRGMHESGGRRIKRTILINLRSVRFVDPETRERYKRFYLIRDYITERQAEIERYNAEHDFDTSELINGRRMTNIGVFRKYAEAYLRNHKGVRQDMTLLVRHLAIEDKGLPLEIYCFTNTVVWAEYESIQADIFDHLLSAIPYFGLEVFQQPAGSDIETAIREMRGQA